MTICVFTGTRAEYGLLVPLIRRIQDDPDTSLQLLVSGSHLSPRHGHTVDAIRLDGFTVDAEVSLPLDDDSPVGIASAMGKAVEGYTRALDSMKPDILVLLGDRYECFACSIAASLLNTPLAHIHGGEVTEGAVDDSYRHAITKMAQLHFTACEQYRQRVIQLGEQPDTVFSVGALGVENAETIPLISKAELESDLGFNIGEKCLLTTYHPVTRIRDGREQLEECFAALRALLTEDQELTAIITGANADAGGSAIDALSAKLAKAFPRRIHISPSLGLVRYLSAMKYCGVVFGNSSSGILEAPSFAVPTVNIGDRQKGRIMAESVFNTPPNKSAIIETTLRALASRGTPIVKEVMNPYGKKQTSRLMLEILKTRPLSLKKRFFDVECHHPYDEV